MNQFKEGDRVVAARATSAPFYGKVATVLALYSKRGTEYLTVNFDHRHGEDTLAASKFDLIRAFAAVPLASALPIDSGERKKFPMFSGLLAYFPAALAQVSNHSFEGNEKHNPGLPLQHARGISGDHEDCIVRHLIDAKEQAAGSAKRIEELRACAWRTLALLQEECELAGCAPAPAASFDRVPK